ncbi:MAG TPA: hypothetical protein VF916_02590 [Ktedonobacterales bacterium]
MRPSFWFMNTPELEALRAFRSHVYTLFGCRRVARTPPRQALATRQTLPGRQIDFVTPAVRGVTHLALTLTLMVGYLLWVKG